MNSLVSIIIPTHNRVHLIGETLESVIAQTYKNWECIVVDDGSNDYTDQLMEFYCERDARIQFYHRPAHKPKGANACRNYGFALSKGAYINWFDSDDIMHPEKLTLQYFAVVKHDLDIHISQSIYFKRTISDDNLNELKSFNFESDLFNDFISYVLKFFTPSSLIKRDFLEKQQITFNEKLHRNQEFEFYIHVLANKAKVTFSDKVLTFVRSHSSSISFSGYAKEKAMSIFYSNFIILQKYPDRINQKSIAVVKDRIITVYSSLLINKDFDSAKEIIDRLSQSLLTNNLYRLKFKLAYFSYRFFNGGNKILRF
ncbi:glycosyltransferase family 2 protein [Zunongwangia profunda]|uniref:glycosyltransferase family 2 protein n=1 Tax=Zunongwangia profunda TaxID=398743 RepID=UPI0002FD60FB|nr:glycosyltransferase family 2 protein [Zunongwangia profunda]